jgi:hypothetical protein
VVCQISKLEQMMNIDPKVWEQSEKNMYETFSTKLGVTTESFIKALKAKAIEKGYLTVNFIDLLYIAQFVKAEECTKLQ